MNQTWSLHVSNIQFFFLVYYWLTKADLYFKWNLWDFMFAFLFLSQWLLSKEVVEVEMLLRSIIQTLGLIYSSNTILKKMDQNSK